MISWFRRNETLFNRLVEMARSESTVRRVAADFLRTETEAFEYPQVPEGFTLERWNNYRKLFTKLRLEEGIEFWNRDAVSLYATSYGIVVSGSTKGYVWSAHSPKPLVDSLDPPLPVEGELPGDDYAAYRAINGNWYIFRTMS
ncbi:hypothetical protein FHR70_004566 [Microvirga lupini]|uniref:Uncharacterized protein n=1 Tax=Microvirga lupini TaxID=420324 RepID=A0A7W4YYH4_9HYPH|nr:hypothetical protein [Microvirga lupini]MBB3021470.1 hypothetical protein [Microvirga lupini]